MEPAGEAEPRVQTGLAAGLGPLLLLTSIFFISFLARIAIAPLLPTIEADLGLTHAQAGSLFLLIALGYFPGLVGAGLVSSRLDHRRTIIVSALAVGLALLLTGLSQGLWGLKAGLLLLGLAAGLYLPSGLATLTSLVGPRHWGKALAVHELAPNLSFVLAPLVAEALLGALSWRGVLAVMGAASLGLGFCFWRWGRGGQGKGQVPNLANLGLLARERGFWIMLALFSLGIGGSLGVFTMLPLFLVSERGMELAGANLLIALSRLSGMGAAFAAGWITDRLGPRAALAGVFALGGASTMLLGAAEGGWQVACLFLQPMVAVCFFPAGFAALARVGPEGARPVAVSLTVPVAYILGGGALPAGIGYLGEKLSFAWGIGLAGGVTLLALALLPLLNLAERGRSAGNGPRP